MIKQIIRVVEIIFLCILGLCGLMFSEQDNAIIFPNEDIPLSGVEATLIKEQQEDITIIPDKYNTGAKGTLTPITSDCYISGVKFGTTGTTGRKLDLYYQPSSVAVPDTIIVENYDFSSGVFRVYNVDLVEKDVTVVFRNCKFKSYIISGSGKVQHIFENCTFTHFAGSNAKFTNCYFGGGVDGDGINPMINCEFENCMIADLIQKADEAGEKHIDGFQIFGSTSGVNNSNIHLKNCRFEMPHLRLSTPSGAMNCPLSIIMRYSDAIDISFRDCYVNGGLYYAMMILDNDQTITNLTMENIHIGESSKSLYTCDNEYGDYVKSAISVTDALYVASVRKQTDGIHISVTNDTNEERKLSVVTSGGVEEYTIAACPKSINLEEDSVTYVDFPFDIDIVIPDTEWVVCFDTTGVAKQIRFVNWSDDDVYVNMSLIGNISADVSSSIEDKVNDNIELNETITTTESSAVSEGICGNNVSYVFSNGVLTLKGSGATYDYHSGKVAPWNDYREDVLEICVEEGIAKLGNYLFAGCVNAKNVSLPNGLISIGSNVFKQCKSIEYIYIPKTLTSIGARSFTGTITCVEYGGTEGEWNELVVGDYNGALLNAQISYNVNSIILHEGMCGECISWNYTADGTLTLTGEGQTYNYHSGNPAPWFDYASEIKNIVIEDGITKLGNYIFRDCKNVANIYLPGSVKGVGTNCFSRCKGLTEISFSNALTSIGKNAFAATNISIVNYYGTDNEWDVYIGDYFGNAQVNYK